MARDHALGDTLTISVIDAALVVVCLLHRRWGPAALVVVVAIGGWAVRVGVRNLTARPRPADAFWRETGASFPSGHTTNTALMVGLVMVVVWPHLRGQARRLPIVGGATCTLAVGFSRAAGGVHWPSDVVAGLLLAIGLMCAVVAVWPSARQRGRNPHRK